MKEQIKSQAHRKFKHLENYISLDTNKLPDEFQDVILQEQEELIGMYKIKIQGVKDSLLLTTHTIYVNKEGHITSIPLQLLKSFDSPPKEEKHTADSLTLHLKSGKTVNIPIQGGVGNLRDVWAFVSFFRKIISYNI